MERQEQVRLIKGLMHYLDTDTNVDAGGQVRNPVSGYSIDRGKITTNDYFSIWLNHTCPYEAIYPFIRARQKTQIQ